MSSDDRGQVITTLPRRQGTRKEEKMLIPGIISAILGFGFIIWGVYTPRKNFGVEAPYAPEALAIGGGIFLTIGILIMIAPFL